jgi:putative ABC transport system substrate-binding protein
MRRRQFIAGLGSAAAWPVVARAQERERVRRIDVLFPGNENEPAYKPCLSAFTQALADLGWTAGRNMRIDLRSGGADANRIQALAKELVALQPDIIVTSTTLATVAVQRETRTIPTVTVASCGPVPSMVAGNVRGGMSAGGARRRMCALRSRRTIERGPMRDRRSVAPDTSC